jgi:hypothetical protein
MQDEAIGPFNGYGRLRCMGYSTHIASGLGVWGLFSRLHHH